MAVLSLVWLPPGAFAADKKFRVLTFPQDQSVGRIYVLLGNKSARLQQKSLNQSWDARGTLKLDPTLALAMEGSYALGEHPEILRSLPCDALRHLKFDKLDLGDKDLANLSHLTDLVRLEMEGCDITDNGIEKLAGLKQLEYLSLSHTLVAGNTIGKLKSIPHLQSLDLNHCDLSKTDLAGIADLKDIRYLHLSNCCLNDSGVASIARLPLLETLSMPDNKAVTGAGIKKLAACKHLKMLNVCNTKVQAADMESLKGVDLAHLEMMPDQGTTLSLAKLKTLFPHARLLIKSGPRVPLDLFRPLH